MEVTVTAGNFQKAIFPKSAFVYKKLAEWKRIANFATAVIVTAVALI